MSRRLTGDLFRVSLAKQQHTLRQFAIVWDSIQCASESMHPVLLEVHTLFGEKQRWLSTGQASAVLLHRVLPSLMIFAPWLRNISRRGVQRIEFLTRISSGCSWDLPYLRSSRAWHRAWRCSRKRPRGPWVLGRFTNLAPAPWRHNCRRLLAAQDGRWAVPVSAGSKRSHGALLMTNWTRTCQHGSRVLRTPIVWPTVARRMTPSGFQECGVPTRSRRSSSRRFPQPSDERHPNHQPRSCVRHAGRRSSSDGHGVGTRTRRTPAADSQGPIRNSGRQNSGAGSLITSIEASNSNWSRPARL